MAKKHEANEKTETEEAKAKKIKDLKRKFADLAERKSAAVVRVGVPWTPAEFVARAASVPHPFSVRIGVLPDRTVAAIFRFLTKGPKAVHEKRTVAASLSCEWWRSLCPFSSYVCDDSSSMSYIPLP